MVGVVVVIVRVVSAQIARQRTHDDEKGRTMNIRIMLLGTLIVLAAWGVGCRLVGSFDSGEDAALLAPGVDFRAWIPRFSHALLPEAA